MRKSHKLRLIFGVGKGFRQICFALPLAHSLVGQVKATSGTLKDLLLLLEFIQDLLFLLLQLYLPDIYGFFNLGHLVGFLN
jgi:hypothetical protein